MLVKATMIGGTFMHLRFEKTNLGVMVAAGILVTSLILFLYIAPESWNVLAKTTR
jgi:cytochrome c oxidase subunit IV